MWLYIIDIIINNIIFTNFIKNVFKKKLKKNKIYLNKIFKLIKNLVFIYYKIINYILFGFLFIIEIFILMYI